MRPLVLAMAIALAPTAEAGEVRDRVMTRITVAGPQAKGEHHWRDPGVIDAMPRWRERRFWRDRVARTSGAPVRWWHGLPVVRAMGLGASAGPEAVALLVGEFRRQAEEAGLENVMVEAEVRPLGRRRAHVVLVVRSAHQALSLPSAVDPGPAPQEIAALDLADTPVGWRRRAERDANAAGIWRRAARLAHRAGVERAEVSLAQPNDAPGYVAAVDLERTATKVLSPIVDITAPATFWGGGLGLKWTGRGMAGAVPRAGLSGSAGYVIYQGWVPKVEFQKGNHGPTAHLAGTVDLARDLATLRFHAASRLDVLAQPGYRGLLATGTTGLAWQPRKEVRLVSGVRGSAWQHRAPDGQEAPFATLFDDGPAIAASAGQVLAPTLRVNTGFGASAALRPYTQFQAQVDPVGWVRTPNQVQRFHRVWGRFDLARPLGDPRVMGSLSVEGGALTAQGGAVAALTERFYLGSSALPGRGWRALEVPGLAFPDADEPRFGGEILAAVRGDLRVDIAHGLHGIVHGNVGRVWMPSVSPVRAGDLVPAVGLGAGILTPMGRFDLLGVAWLGSWDGPGPPPPRAAIHLFLVP